MSAIQKQRPHTIRTDHHIDNHIPSKVPFGLSDQTSNFSYVFTIPIYFVTFEIELHKLLMILKLYVITN